MFLLFESRKPEDAAYVREVSRQHSASQKSALLEECLQHISDSCLTVSVNYWSLDSLVTKTVEQPWSSGMLPQALEKPHIIIC